MHMNSTRVFTCPIREELGGTVTANLHYETNGIGGSIQNGTRCRLEGGVLFWGRVAQRVGAIAPGGRTALDPNARWGLGAQHVSPSARRSPAQPPGPPAEQRICDAALESIRRELSRPGAPLLK